MSCPPRRSGLAIVLACALACSTPPVADLVPTHDLAVAWVAADVVAETRSLTFDPAEGRRSLISGWSQIELDAARERHFAWATGPASTLALELLEARDVPLVLEGRPFVVADGEPQAVTVSVNEHTVAELELEAHLASYQVLLPERYLVAGSNRVELAYRRHSSPRQLGISNDPRELSVAWYGIHFETGEGTPRLEEESGRLFLPFGTGADFYLELDTRAEVRFEQLTVRGAGQLDVELQQEHGAPSRITFGKTQTDVAVPMLAGAQSVPTRLRLRALPAAGGRGGIFLSGAAVWTPPSAQELPAVEVAAGPAQRPNIVVYLIDTLRADHLGCYGDQPSVSPRIDAFAEQAVLFEHVVAQSSWTRAAVASIFTGQWPRAHGANGRSDRLSDDASTLSEQLREVGYQTAAFVTNPNVTPRFGFDQGFDTFEYLGEETTAAGITQAAVEWLDQRTSSQPFLLYLHTLDPHAPYSPPEAYRQQLAPDVDAERARRSLDLLNDLQAGRRPLTPTLAADLGALYDAEIAFNDASFGALLDQLEERDLTGDTVIVLLSDHGEEFHEHGNWQHGRSLHTESIDVPLIIKLPTTRAGRRVAERVRQIDLLPTFLDLLGITPGKDVEGRSLLPLLTGEEQAPSPRAFSYLHLDGPARVSVVDGEWKLIQQIEHGELTLPRLYRVSEDRGEQQNLAESLPIRTGYMATLLRAKLALEAYREAEQVEIDEDLRRSLEALGYLD